MKIGSAPLLRVELVVERVRVVDGRMLDSAALLRRRAHRVHIEAMSSRKAVQKLVAIGQR